MERHERLKAAAKAAITELHGDTTVDIETTRDSLDEIREEIEIMIEALDSDLEAGRGE